MPEAGAVDPSGQKDWDELLRRTPGSSFFHTSAWAAVLREAYRYEPLYFTILREAALEALLPVVEVNSPLTGKRGVSLPFTDYCEPIANGASAAAQFQEIFAAAVAMGKKRGWRYLELRGGEAFLGQAEPSEWHYAHGLDLGKRKKGTDLFSGAKTAKTVTDLVPDPNYENLENLDFSDTPAKVGGQNILKGLDSGFRRNDGLSFSREVQRSPLSNPACIKTGTTEPTETNADLLALFSDTTRRNIKKAEKQNLDVSVSTSPDSMQAFCRLNALTRRLHGLPPQPRRFFQCVQDRILSQGKGFIVLASQRGNAIAANVYFTFGDQLLYKYGASDRALQHLRASNLAMWEAIRWGRDHGYRSLCLGRTEPGNEGLRQFKLGWGAEERVVRYYRYDLRKEAFVRTPQTVRPLHKKIFGRLPIPVLNALGSILYRHMG